MSALPLPRDPPRFSPCRSRVFLARLTLRAHSSSALTRREDIGFGVFFFFFYFVTRACARAAHSGLTRMPDRMFNLGHGTARESDIARYRCLCETARKSVALRFSATACRVDREKNANKWGKFRLLRAIDQKRDFSLLSILFVRAALFSQDWFFTRCISEEITLFTLHTVFLMTAKYSMKLASIAHHSSFITCIIYKYVIMFNILNNNEKRFYIKTHLATLASERSKMEAGCWFSAYLALLVHL